MHEMEGKDGTKKSGFVTDETNKPPRQCGNCIWNSYGLCNHEDVREDPELINLRVDDGRVKVKPTWCCDYFQSHGNALIYVVRHGDTNNNKQNLFRGWINVSLNADGKKQAQDVQVYLSDKGIKEAYASDLDRAVTTSKIAYTKKNPTKDKLLRPWDVGIFSGQERAKYQAKLNHFIDNPNEEIPDGESLQQFADRCKRALNKYIGIAKETSPIVLFAHSSNVIQFEKIVEGKDELGRPEDVDRISPGGVMVILSQPQGLKAEITFGAKTEKPANYGS